jgi:hypothetical protein
VYIPRSATPRQKFELYLYCPSAQCRTAQFGWGELYRTYHDAENHVFG